MSIKDFTEKIMPSIDRIREGIEIKDDLFIIALIALTGLASFGLGKVSALENKPEIRAIPELSKTVNDTSTNAIRKIPLTPSQQESSNMLTNKLSGPVYASKNGTRYYYAWCTGLNRIKEENKITFKDKTEAESAGLKLASGCN